MDIALSTGNAIVDEVSEMNLTGNIVPSIWFKTMRNESGKPMLLAIEILSDIVYWYRAKEIRDEGTGTLIGYKKKFKKDFLQRSYRQIEEQYGVTKKQARLAIEYLCDIGVIRKHLRNETTKDGIKVYNSMYLELVPKKLKEITYPHRSFGGVPCRASPSAPQETTLVPYTTEGGDLQGTTNTKITTETTTKDYINPIYQGNGSWNNTDIDQMDRIEEISMYREIIRDNLEYDIMRSRLACDSEKNRLDEIYEIICDVVNTTNNFVRIGGEDYPSQVVKSVFLKLRYEHVEYVMDCLDKTNSQIGNMRSYLITALYRSMQTMENSINQNVNHGMYKYVKNHGLS